MPDRWSGPRIFWRENMKKSLLVLLAIALVGSFAFAEITGVGAPTVSGSVSTTFGYDLYNEASGFVNDSDLTLTLPLLDGSAVKGGSDKYYGEITVDGIGWQLNQDGFYDVDEDADGDNKSVLDASISAKLVLDKFFVKLGNPGFDMNNVDVSDDYLVDANAYKDDALKDWTGGASFGYASDMFTVEVKVASKNDYRGAQDDVTATVDDEYTDPFDNDTEESDDAETYTAGKNEYVFGAALTINPLEGVTVPVTFSYNAKAPSDALIAVGAAPSFAFAPLTINLPIDYVMYGDMYGFEIAPSVSYVITEGADVALTFVYGMYEDTVPYANGAVGDFSLTFTEAEEKGFVENLAATLKCGLVDMLDYNGTDKDMGWTVDADLSYNLNGLKPYVNCGYGSDEVFDLGVGVILGADFTGLDNTTITLDYTNEQITPDPTAAIVNRVTLNVTVAF